MRILMTNHSLKDTGGTEKWTHALAVEFMRRGHEVDVFTFMRGVTSEKLEEAGARIVEEPRDEYNVMFSNHCTCLGFLTTRLSCPKIHTSHGPAHQLEIPTLGADVYVAVSWEVRARHAALGFYQELIGNGVDLDDFYDRLIPPYEPAQPIEPRNPRVLSMCKDVNATNMVRIACEQAGMDFDSAHYTDDIVWDVASEMRACDIVVACGRSAIEALACGRDVLVFDWRDPREGPTADGWITEANVRDLAQSNFSCRHRGHHWGLGELIEALKARPSPTGKPGWQRQWASNEADVRKQADAYLALVPKAEEKHQNQVHDPDLTAEYQLEEVR